MHDPPPRPRGRPDALRLRHARRARLLRGAPRRPRRRARRWRWRSSRCTRPMRCAGSLADDDVDALCLVPGVGKKTAARLLVELKSAPAMPDLGAAVRRRCADRRRAGRAGRADVREALAGLGYGRTRSATPWPTCPPTATPALLLKRGAAERLAGGDGAEPRMRGRAAATRRGDEEARRPSRSASGPAASTSSSARPSSRSTSAIILEAARRRGQAADHLLLRRPARSRQDDPRPHRRQRDGRGHPRHLGPRPRARRRPRRHPHQPRGRRRPVHRRDPPPARAPSKRCSTRRWRTSSSTSCWARARRPARSASTCPRFTLVGATTRTGLITGPLRDRFGLVARLDYYEPDDLEAIVGRAAGILGVHVDGDGAGEIAGRARGTPRIANRLLRRVRDFAEVRGDGTVDLRHGRRRPRPVRRRRARPRQGRPRGPRGALRALRRRPGRASTLAISVGEPDETVEDVYEPFLIQRGLLMRTPRGRVATPAAWAHLGLVAPAAPTRTANRSATELFERPGSGTLVRAHGHRRVRLRPATAAHRPDAGRAPRRGPAARRRGPGRAPDAPARPRPPRRRRARATSSWSTTPGCCRPGSASPAHRRRGGGAAARAASTTTPVGGAGPAQPQAGRPAPCSSSATTSTVVVGDDLGEGRRRGRARAWRRRADLLEVLGRHGEVPLPPYITAPLADPERYQTVYAAAAGLGGGADRRAAPHRRRARRHPCRSGPGWRRVELVVGLDTFRPIAVDQVEDHVMHSERYRVPDGHAGRLPSAARRGWWPSARPSVRALESAAATGALEGRTDLFIHGDRRSRSSTC